jgi:hypothetical protein
MSRTSSSGTPAHADESGVPTLSSIALVENRRRSGSAPVAQRLGFAVRHEPGGAGVMRIERHLRRD